MLVAMGFFLFPWINHFIYASLTAISLIWSCYSSFSSIDTKAQGVKVSLEPVPACREDFSRLKLTSFDKLIERTCSLIKNVRLCSEPGQRPGGGAGTSAVAPDAIEIQLKSPNWLFGQKKDELNASAAKVATSANANGSSEAESGDHDFCDLSWLSSTGDFYEEDLHQRYLSLTSVDEASGWYGGSLLGDLDESSEIYRHYAELCEGPAMEPFENDVEREQHYADALHQSMIENIDDVAIEYEMEGVLKEYDNVALDLGISPLYRSMAADPSHLTRWILGEDNLHRVSVGSS